jgi:3-oxoacyl-[acyl-carrier-protein] synthase-3
VKNDDLRALMDTSDEWIQQRTGIKQRHWVDGETSTSDLALEASKRALDAAGVKKEDLDMIILGTLSPDHEFPGTACFLQAKLGVSGIPALDVRQQCSGFIYGMSIADQFIRGGVYKRVLLVGAEVHSKGLDKTTKGRDVAVLFGDGAGAVVLGAENGPARPGDSQIYSTHLHADGAYAKELYTHYPSFAYPSERTDPAGIERGENFPRMNGKTVFVHASRRMPEAVMEALNTNGMKIGDVDLFVFHQANLRINEMVAKQLGIPEEKVFNTIDRFANTTAATIPLGLDEAVKAGRLKKGMLVASAAFGSGFTWASALYRW